MRDIAFNTFQDSLAQGYAIVFIIQAIGLLLAAAIFTRINVPEFRNEIARYAGKQLEKVGEHALVP